MPKRDWFIHATSGIIAGAVFLAVTAVVAGIAYDQRSKLRASYEEYKKTSDAHRRQAAEEVYEACNWIAVESARRDCIVRELETAAAKDAGNKDLEAQQKMAYWAAALFWTAVFQIFLAGAGIYWIIRTFNANSAAVEQASRANDITEQNAIADRRAWLDVEVTFTDNMKRVGDGLVISLDIYTTNYGASPALETRFNVRRHDMPSWLGVEAVRGDRLIKATEEKTVLHPAVFPGNRIRLNGYHDISSGMEPVLLVCLVYKVVGSEETHLTCKTYRLAYKRPDGFPGRIEKAPNRDAIPGIAHEFGSFTRIT